MKSLTLEDSLTFGKHRDKQVEDDPSYVRWLIEEKDFDFARDVIEALSKRENRR